MKTYTIPTVLFTLLGVFIVMLFLPIWDINSEPKPKLTTIHIVVGKDTVEINNGIWIDVRKVHCSSVDIDWENGITTIEICKSDSPINKTILPQFK